MLAFLILLERLSPAQRYRFIEAHCRLFPTFAHPWLAQAPRKARKLQQLLGQKARLSFVTGASDFARTQFVTAVGHSFLASNQKKPSVAGIDLHLPLHFVPVDTVTYINTRADSREALRAAVNLWPKIATSGARVLILNRVWSAAPELHKEFLRCSTFKNVVAADEQIPDPRHRAETFKAPLQILRLTGSMPGRRQIRIHFQVTPLKNA